ncbi:EAL domain-containing protein [uncultured Roseibium sp.]|uniref:EAL domain-containing protein n=1 Tax=uncultured Roseibium sp. TaxID=1936171 RepID=UPI00261FFC57|nr:EAL domain-containing protein [uncultured Roseibium sp.]
MENQSGRARVQTWQGDHKKRFLYAFLAVICTIAAVGLLRLAGVGTAFDRFLWEVRFQIDHRPVSGEIVIVDIDARSLEEIGVWPLPRRLFAQVTDRLIEEGAQEILFDVDFSTASSSEDDRLLAEAFERAGNVSLAVFRQAAAFDGASGEIVNQPVDVLLDTAWPVVVMVPMESDGRIWNSLYGYEIGGASEISAAAFLGDHTGKTGGTFGLDYSIAQDELQRISLVDVLNGTGVTGRLFGKKVIIGASAQELRDLFPVPVYGILPGSVIQALGAETLLQNRALAADGQFLTSLFALAVLFMLMLTRIEGWSVKILILTLTAIALELVAFQIQKSFPVLVQSASAHFILLFGASIVVFRELGFHKLGSRLAAVGKRNSERMLGQVFDDSFDAIIVVREDGQITAANRMARSLFPGETLVGSAARKVLPQELADEMLAVFEKQSFGMPASRTLFAAKENGNRQFIEYVVTRSEQTVVTNSRQSETRMLACLTCRDVTQERGSAEKLSYLARFEPITGLLNRNGFEEELESRVRAARQGGQTLCLVQFAIANLDQIMASLGFTYGDRVRQAVASRLRNLAVEEISWSAISPDVFAGVATCEPGEDKSLELIEAVRAAVGGMLTIDGARITIRLKFGYVLADGCTSPDRLLKNAGNALAKVRREDRSSVQAFRPELDETLLRRCTLETELLKAISRDELRVYYQPLVVLADRTVFGAEALLRWDHPKLGPVSPAEFIPIAEENGYIVELGEWVLNRAMKEASSWNQPLELSVNVSAVQISQGTFVATVAEALERSEFAAERLGLEVTESLFIDENLELETCMEELRSLGCHFSLDDFGTGYSSLGYIPRYPFSRIKLDRSFVTPTMSSRQDIAVVEAVLNLARGYGMSVIAEGIETPDQAGKLLELGCQLGQGYLFGRPMDATGFAALLRKAA